LGTLVVVGYANSIFTLGSCAACFAFGKIYRKIDKAIILFSYAGTAIAIFALMTIPTLVALYITSFFRGGLVGFAFTYCYSICPAIVPKEKSYDAVGFLSAIYSFGFFLSPFAVSWSMKFIGKGRYTPTLVVPVILCVMIFFVQLLLNIKQQKIYHSGA
jgi:hypothetical protein